MQLEGGTGLSYTSMSQPIIEGYQSKDPRQEPGTKTKAETGQKHRLLACSVGLFSYLSSMPWSYLPKTGTWSDPAL